MTDFCDVRSLFLQGEIQIMSTQAEIDKLDRKLQNMGKIVVEETTEKFASAVGSADITFLDNVSLLNEISAFMKEKSFVVLHSGSLSDVKLPENCFQISDKFSNQGEFTLIQKVSELQMRIFNWNKN